jgi:hypothetical protein
MRRLVWLVVLGAVAYLGYTFYTRTISSEESQVYKLEREFRQATDRYITAMRQAGEPGLVILADPETAEKMVKDIRPRLEALMKTLTRKDAIDRARELESELLTFMKKNQIE